MPDAADYYDIGDDCRSWAWPWKRNGIGIWENAASASISDGYLKTIFSQGYGQFQGTKLKLTDWFPSGPNGTYTVPRYCRGAATVTQPCWQNSMWLPTSEARAVRTGTIEASVDYTDRGAKNFRLASTSACKNWATDGSPPGANQDMVE